jgi:predicted nucleic acid-binding protein
LAQYTHRALSAVVLSELVRAASSAADLAGTNALEHEMRERLFAPTVGDWKRVADHLRKHLARPGKLNIQVRAKIAKEQNDALIALSTWALGHVLVSTDNGYEALRAAVGAPTRSLIVERVPSP